MMLDHGPLEPVDIQQTDGIWEPLGERIGGGGNKMPKHDNPKQQGAPSDQRWKQKWDAKKKEPEDKDCLMEASGWCTQMVLI